MKFFIGVGFVRLWYWQWSWSWCRHRSSFKAVLPLWAMASAELYVRQVQQPW